MATEPPSGAGPTWWFDLVLVSVVGLVIRATTVLSSAFPLNDGGLFAAMAQDLVRHGLTPPVATSYNGGGIPFVYPPLALDLAAGISSAFNVGTADLFRMIPLVASVVTVPLVFVIARELVPDGRFALLAGMAYALTPRAYDWFVMGGGLTRGIGMAFALLAIWRWIAALRSGSWTQTVTAGAALGLAALTHPQAAVFGAVSIGVMWLGLGRTRQSFGRLVAVALISTITLLPWLASLAVNGTLGHLFAAMRLGAQPLTGLAWMLGMAWTDAPRFDVMTPLALIGVIYCLARREYLLPAWLAATFLADARGGATYATVPLALLVAQGLEGALFTYVVRRPRAILITGTLLALLAVAGTASLRVEGAIPLTALDADTHSAMAWASDNSLPNARFVVVSDAPWWGDAAGEWFPTLTGRVSVGTVQGTEWVDPGAFGDAQAARTELATCVTEGTDCLLAWLALHPADYALVPAGCCNGFKAAASHSPAFSLVHADGEAVIYRLSASGGG